MDMTGKYILTYTIDRVLEELIVDVELKPVRGLLKQYQNAYYGIAYVNGSFYDKTDLTHCVNAKFAAEEIGLELKDELKKKYRKEGKSFRLKNEELKGDDD